MPRLPWYYWYAIAACVAFFLLLFNEFVAWRDWSPSDWAAWFGALGTYAAFGGTIWLASADQRRRRREEDHRTLAAAIEYFPKVHGLRKCAEYFSDCLADPGLADWKERQKEIAEIIRKQLNWDVEMFSRLDALPKMVAPRLAEAQGRLRSALSAHLRSTFTAVGLDTFDALRECTTHLRAAHILLVIAESTMEDWIESHKRKFHLAE